ncbi:colicin import membrane protein [Polaromonas sp. CG_9.5]|uniref:hypothetical protein n=1 Tax=Polaromonas sp. CG_9.5 TaxID=3071705 RepID=UPI002DF9A31E|nr:colicin import membrane protein [Polaromonas sp. CG_9.5]
MKIFSVLLWLVSLSQLAFAQNSELSGEAGNIGIQRTAVNAERSRLEAGFLSEDAACYKKFAVNSCLGKVNSRRREAMADFRRQEIFLNDAERRIKGENQIRKTQEKASPENQQQAADSRAKAVEVSQGRLDSLKDKQQKLTIRESNEKAARAANAQRLLAHQQKNQARAEKQAANEEKAKKFSERQKEAQERRSQHDADQLKHTKPSAKPLPLPE